MRVIFTCGGTAGHINPALALAKRIEAGRPGTEILFVGAVGGSIEADLVPKAGYPFRQVDVSSFWRKANWRGLKHNVKAAGNIIRSRREARAILDEFKPDLVVGTGGYASYPVTREAARRGIPTAIHESNAIPGLTTRRLAPHVDVVMVGLPDVEGEFPKGARVVVTGTPVRPDFFSYTRREARAKLGLSDERPLVLSYWGSLGARDMNEQMVGYLALCAQAGCPFHHIHGAGERYYEDVLEGLKSRGVDLADHPELSVREYIYDMPLVMAAADLVLCRAGASTISELTTLGKPAILVPSPNVTRDHQTKNARVLSQRGGVELLPEGSCTPQRLWEDVNALLDDAPRRKAMGASLAQMAPADAGECIYETLMALLDK